VKRPRFWLTIMLFAQSFALGDPRWKTLKPSTGGRWNGRVSSSSPALHRPPEMITSQRSHRHFRAMGVAEIAREIARFRPRALYYKENTAAPVLAEVTCEKRLAQPRPHRV
jgi:hypothetical protein